MIERSIILLYYYIIDSTVHSRTCKCILFLKCVAYDHIDGSRLGPRINILVRVRRYKPNFSKGPSSVLTQNTITRKYSNASLYLREDEIGICPRPRSWGPPSRFNLKMTSQRVLIWGFYRYIRLNKKPEKKNHKILWIYIIR